MIVRAAAQDATGVPFEHAHEKRGALDRAAYPILARVAKDRDGARTGLPERLDPVKR